MEVVRYRIKKGDGTLKKSFIIIDGAPKIVRLEDEDEVFGKVKEIIPTEAGAKKAGLAVVTLWGPDIIHHHRKAEEIYACFKGEGYIFLAGKVYNFVPGVRVIIKPGTLHAARPKKPDEKLVFLCVSSPTFDPKDMFEGPCGRIW